MPELTTVIVSFNTRALLGECLDTLIGSSRGVDNEIIVVDNGSRDGSQEFVRENYPRVHLIANTENLGFARANNRGIEDARSPVILLLNSDAFVNPELIAEGLRILNADSSAGMVGVRLVGPDGSTQAEDGKFPSLWTDVEVSLGLNQLRRNRPDTDVDNVRYADWVQGACLFVRREAINASGLLDDAFFMYSEEVDWCHRFWQHGWRVVYCGRVSAVHLGGSSSTDNDLGRRASLYRSRLGLRRRLGGPISSAALWGAMVAGFGIRVPAQWLIQTIPGHSPRGHSPRDDWRLLRKIVAMDPVAEWAKTD